MPYTVGKLKGQLTTLEIRKLISAHNKLTDIKIKKGSTRDDIIKLLKNNGYVVDHGKQSLIPTDRPRKKPITLTQAKEVTKPKPKTEIQKQKSKEKKEEKEVVKKKEVREIKKKAIEEQKSISKKKVISKPVSKITKDVGTQYSPPKFTPPPKSVKDKVKAIEKKSTPKPVQEPSKPPPKELTTRERNDILLKSYNLPTPKDYDDFVKKISTKKDGKKKMLDELTKKERDTIYEFQVKILKELNKYQGKTDGKANFSQLQANPTTKQDTDGISDFDRNFDYVVGYLQKYKPAKK